MAPGSPGPATLVACFLGQVTLLSCSYWLNQAPAEEPAPPAPPAAFPAAEPPPVAPACTPPGHTDWAVGLFSLVTFLAGIGAAVVVGLAAQVSTVGAFLRRSWHHRRLGLELCSWGGVAYRELAGPEAVPSPTWRFSRGITSCCD